MIFVTGANGFVGRHLVQRLAASGQDIRAMVRNRAAYIPPAGVEVVEGDVTRPETLAAAVSGVDIVVHCAAITGNIKEPYRDAYDIVNRGGTENLISAAKAAGVKRIVALSGLGTMPAPKGTYMATRWGLEEAVRSSTIPYVIIRPSVQFGDGAEFVAALARLIRRSPIVPLLGGGKLRFQPIWVEDVVTCIERSLNDETLLDREHTIGGNEQFTFKEILQTISNAVGKKRLLAPLPLPIARLQARIFTAIMRRPPLTPATIELFSFDNVTDLDSVEQTFGFKPRGFREHLLSRGVER
jgi:NADH dehydrogenase